MVTDVTIKNSGRLDVLLTAVRSSASDWIDLQQPTVEVNPLRAGEELDIVFAIKTDRMSIGKTAFLLTFLVEVSSFGIGNHYCTNLDPYYHSFPFFSG